MTQGYLARVVSFVATLTGWRSKSRLAAQPKPAPAAPKKKRAEVPIGRRKQLAYGAFPNHFGNYLGKREPRPEPPRLTARERFIRLLASFEERARDYRWKRQQA